MFITRSDAGHFKIKLFNIVCIITSMHIICMVLNCSSHLFYFFGCLCMSISHLRFILLSYTQYLCFFCYCSFFFCFGQLTICQKMHLPNRLNNLFSYFSSHPSIEPIIIVFKQKEFRHFTVTSNIAREKMDERKKRCSIFS